MFYVLWWLAADSLQGGPKTDAQCYFGDNFIGISAQI